MTHIGLTRLTRLLAAAGSRTDITDPTDMSLKTDAFLDLDRELATTRVFLERVPDEHLQWRPHEKSLNLVQIAAHLATLPTWQIMTLTTDGFDVTGDRPQLPEPDSAEELVALFDKNVAELKDVMETVDDELLREKWSLREGDKAFWTDSKLSFPLLYLL